MRDGKRRGVDEPEQDYAGVECIDQKTRKRNARQVSFPKPDLRAVRFLDLNLLKENVKYTQRYKEAASQVADEFLVLQ